MIDRKFCIHESIRFGSGDYYVFCDDCDARWVASSLNVMEYGYDKDGKRIGADPTVCLPNDFSGVRKKI